MKMMILVFILTFSLKSIGSLTVPITEKANFNTDVQMQTHYNYNVFYNYASPVSDGSISISPTFTGHTKPKFLYFDGDAKGRYEKFFSQTIQDHFNFDLDGRMLLNEGGYNSLVLDMKQSQFSDPSFTTTYGRVVHDRSLVNIEYKHKFEWGNVFSLVAKYKNEDITTPAYLANKNYLSHYDADLIGKYDIKFLPETSWFIRMSGGYRYYKNQYLAAADVSDMIDSATAFGELAVKTRSGYFLAEAGLNGRLTDKTSVDFATGYLARIYPFWDDFVSPVFYMRFTEQVTRRDQLLAGYNYVVEDAYTGNYYLNQEIYIGIAKVIGDQLLALTKITYEYKNYSTPVSRNDQRITGGLTIKYSVKSDFKLIGDFRLDLLDSDGFDEPASGISVRTGDEPVSYKSGSFSVGIIKSF